MLVELRRVIPAFLARIDQPSRGGRWIEYFDATRRQFEIAAAPFAEAVPDRPTDEVTLTDFDPDGEIKVAAAALYPVAQAPDEALLAAARRLTPDERAALLRAYVGERANRRHKPGRAFERTSYRFDVLADYGAFRDLQRHRMLTIEWQRLSPAHGYVEPAAIEEAGALADWRRVMERSADLYDGLSAAGLALAAPYALAMAYRVRFYMHMNAREAMHLIELRTSPQGHPSYRRICQAMHRAIRDTAGHRAIADSMSFADHSEVELERLQAERAQRVASVPHLTPLQHLNLVARDRRRDVRQRDEITARTARAALGDTREHVVVQQVEQPLDDVRAHAGVPFRQAVRAQQHRSARDLAVGNAAGARAEVTDDALLQTRRTLGRDLPMRAVAEAGRDAVDRDLAVDQVDLQAAGRLHPLDGGRRDSRSAAVARDGDDVLDRERATVEPELLARRRRLGDRHGGSLVSRSLARKQTQRMAC
jgi:hypothetical protein